MASIPGLEHLEKDGWEIVGFDYVSQDEYCVGEGGRVERWICKYASPTKRLIIRKVQHPKPAKQSWTPKIGDVVWVRAKVWDRSRHPDRLMLEVGNGEIIAGESDCKPYAEPDLKQAIREVMLSKELLEPLTAAFSAISVQAIAKAVADELRGSWAKRLTEPAKRQTLDDSLVGVWVPPANAEAPWTPKVGDWVKVTKPVDCAPAHKIWWVQDMDQFDGKVMQVTSVWAQISSAKLDDQVAWDFDFAWLAPAEDPRGQPAPKHRTPTAEDLKNGPIDCEVRMLNSEAWIWRILCGIVDESERPFRTLNGRLQDSKGKWPQCRIEVK
jgi:hypothetical protein